MAVEVHKKYSFGEYELDSARFSLLRGSQQVPLSRKRFHVLLYLIEQRHRVVTRQELIAQFWEGHEVYEDNLTKCISEIRRALDDKRKPYQFIETLPAVGYRYIGRAEEQVITPGASRFSVETTEAVKIVIEEQQDGINPERWLEAKREPAERKTVTALDPVDSPAVEGVRLLQEVPPVRGSSRAIATITILLLIGLMSTIGLAWLWRTPKTVLTKSETSFTFLTDGRLDDNAAYFTDDGQIYFSRYVTPTRAETWRMTADGKNLHRANTEIKNLLTGRWSPDGKKVIFHKDDSDKTVYLANADGSNETTLPFNPGNLDWSYDGSQFVYQARSSTASYDIFLYTLKTGKSTKLINDGADPSFSYDGKLVAFTSSREGNPEIYTMQADGSNVRRLTNHPAFDQYPVFSPDGTQIAFQSNREDERIEIYLQNVNDNSPPKRLTHSSTLAGLYPKCWSADGTQILFYTEQDGKGRVVLANVEPYPAKLFLRDESADLFSPRFSGDSKQLLYEARMADRSLELRLKDQATTRTLFKTEPNYSETSHLEPNWSPDNSLVAFSYRASGNSEIFTVKSDGRELKNLTSDPALDTTPVFSPDGKKIVFARDNYGTAQLYRMDLDGRNEGRISDKPGYEMTPAFSPDGASLIFAGDREGHGLDIFMLVLSNPEQEKTVANRRLHDISPTISPDGRRVAFIAASDGNSEIYLVNSDGTGLFRLTHTKANEAEPQFSKDGKSIFFAADYGGRFAIYEIVLPS